MTNPNSRKFVQADADEFSQFTQATQHAKAMAVLADTSRTNLTNQVSTMTASQQAAFVSFATQLMVSAQAAVTVPIVERPPATEMFSVPQFKAGSIAGQRGFSVLSGTATMNDTGVLTINSDFVFANNRGIVTPYLVSDGIYRFCFPGPSSRWIVSWGGPPGAGSHYIAWGDDGHIQLGSATTNEGPGLKDVITAGVTLTTPTGPYAVELRIGPAFVGSTYNLRAYPADGAIPAEPQLAMAYGVNGVPILPEGPLVLGSLAGIATFQGISVADWKAGPNKIQAKTTLYGPWEPRLEANVMTMTSITTGALARSDVSDTAGVAALLAVPLNQTYRPVIATRYREVGGLTWTDFVRTPANPAGTAGTVQRTDVITGLDPARKYEVDIEFNLDENEPGYLQGTGVCLVDLVVSDGGTIRPTPYGGETCLIIGDSIPAGDVAGGHDTLPNPDSTPSVTYSEESFAHIACDQVGFISINATYGGTGLLVPGSGGMPPTLTNLKNFMQGRPLRSFSPRDPTKICIVIGTNDKGAAARTPPVNVTPAQFTASYRELLNYLQARYPAAALCLMVPFDGSFSYEIATLANEYKTFFVNGSAWSDYATDYGPLDKTHPLRFPPGTIRGHRKLGGLTASAWQVVGFAPAPVVRPSNPTLFETIPGSDFNVLVAANGVTKLPAPPVGAAGVSFRVSGGDLYYTTTGTVPGVTSDYIEDTTPVTITPLSDATAFGCTIKNGAPRLIGNWTRSVN